MKLLLADDHTLFREGLARMLASYGDMEVVGQTRAGDAAVALAKKTRPDAVITEVKMPIEEGKETLLRLMSEVSSSPPKVIVLTIYEDTAYVRETIKLGASAYLHKSSSIEQLSSVIHAALLDLSGESTFITIPRSAVEWEGEVEPEDTLSDRELEVLLSAARGLSNRQIASHLRIAETTVSRHLSNVYRKMKTNSRTGATWKAISKGWISVRDVTSGTKK